MGKLYPLFTRFWLKMARRCVWIRQDRDRVSMVFIAATMFVWLFGWGEDYFHWSDPSGKIQLAMFTSFILGIICGYKTKG